MKRYTIIAALALFVTACGADKTTVVSPTYLPVPQVLGLTSLLGTWDGTTTSTDGHSHTANGTLSVSFTAGVQVVAVNQDPQPCNGNDDNHGHSNGVQDNSNCTPVPISATVAWTSNNTHHTFHGSVSGSLPNLSVTGTDNSCNYNINGSLNGAGNTISGSYSYSGAGCVHDGGNFSISK